MPILDINFLSKTIDNIFVFYLQKILIFILDLN